MEVRVGIVGAAAEQSHAGSDLTNGEIALLHEYGNPSTNLPERAPVRTTFRDAANKAALAALQKLLLGKVLKGTMQPRRALGLLGAWGANAIQATIASGNLPPPLAPRTVAAKGSSAVLVDTGQLARSVTWVVVP